ncbi:MAG: prmC [Bacilli bacterium]|nr:prmC [Bacilli bacterium]
MNKVSRFHLDPCTTVREAILQASLFLDAHGVADARAQAEVLLMFALQWDRAKLFAELHTRWAQLSASGPQIAEFESFALRRAQREPLQYILGGQEFYGRLFHVDKGVLIPRPETEILIESCLKCMREIWPTSEAGSEIRAVDIGTGSGAIAITLALERPDVEMHAVDLSPQALEVARLNARRLQASVHFWQGDLLQPIRQAQIGPVQLVVSNPPYIPTGDIAGLQSEVTDFEPHLALDGGVEGLDMYRTLVEVLPAVMRSDQPRLVAFEVGIHQANQVADLLAQSGLFTNVAVEPDLAGIDRVVLGYAK